jgi:recombinational DNA repair protein (RecF pathway)
MATAANVGLPLLLAAALIKVSAQIGFLPALDNCACCGQALAETEGKAAFFSIAQGGALCESCASATALSESDGRDCDAQLLIWIRLLLYSRFNELQDYLDEAHAELGRLLLDFARDWVRTHIVFRLRALDFYYGLR